MKAPARRQLGHRILLRTYGVVFLVVLGMLVALSVAVYDKAFVDVVHVRLQTDHVGNQLAAAADVKLRGIIVGEVRSVTADGRRATVNLALQPDKVGLIPANVSARLLPKTLFGEKYVDLVIPRQPATARLAEGDVISQDRSSTAIELERVLDDILPLLRTVQPAELNATLAAFATAVEGRGERLGQNLQLVDRYFTRLNPRLDTIKHDIRALADVSSDYSDAAPDLVRTLRNFSVTTRTVADRETAYAGFLAGTTGLATTARGLLADDGDRIIRLAAVSRPTLELLARYSPEYPCLLRGLAESNQLIGQAFAHGELHITLEVVSPRDAYRPGEEPRWGEQSGPSCRGLPRPPVPAPGAHFDDGTRGGAANRAVAGFWLDPDAGPAGSGEEQQVVDTLVAPVLGTDPAQVPDLATLLFGPMVRGTAVRQS